MRVVIVHGNQIVRARMAAIFLDQSAVRKNLPLHIVGPEQRLADVEKSITIDHFPQYHPFIVRFLSFPLLPRPIDTISEHAPSVFRL